MTNPYIKMNTSRNIENLTNVSSNADNEACVVCFGNLKFISIGECDHPVCFECSTRMRVLCDCTECPICRKNTSKVVFLKSIKAFKNINYSAMKCEQRFKIFFEDDDIMKAFDDLLNHICQLCASLRSFRQFKDLQDHMRKIHECFYCDLCVENLKVFTHEKKFYSRSELAQHRRIGDPDDKSHRGHPLCQFCDSRFMDKDELYRHLRREHFYCHFCDADGIQNYYKNYEDLRYHFRSMHFLCEEGNCVEERFVSAFRTKIDLQAHRAQNHCHSMTKSESKLARTVDLPFQYRRKQENKQNKASSFNRREDLSPIDPEELGATALPSTSNGLKRSINIGCAEQFPSLNPALVVASSDNQSQTDRSVAQKLAIKSGFSIRSSSANLMNEEEFPSLNPLKLGKDSTKKEVNNDLTKNRSQNNVLGNQLKNSSSPRKVGKSQATELKQKYSAGDVSSNSINSSQVNLRSGTQNPTFIDKSSKNAKSRNVNNKPDSNRDFNCQLEEFPSLSPGNNAASNQLKNTTSNMPSSFHVSSLSNPHNSNQNSKLRDKSYKTAESRKPSSEPVSSKDTNKDFNCKLEEFPSLSHDKKPVSKPFLNVNQSAIKNKNKSLVNTNKSKSINNNDAKISSNTKSNSLSHSKSYSDQESKKMASTKNKENKRSKFNDDCENIENFDMIREGDYQSVSPMRSSNIKSISSVNIYDKNQKSKTEFSSNFSAGDFPVLKTNSSKLRNKEEIFPKKANTSKELLKSSSKDSSGATSNKNKELIKYSFTYPPSFDSRNKCLIKSITSACQDSSHKFEKFKLYADKFRKGDIGGELFYSTCRETLGTNTFLRILPELLVLLPDIEKQQALLKSYRKFDADNYAIYFKICSICQQVLLTDDFAAHKKSHKN